MALFSALRRLARSAASALVLGLALSATPALAEPATPVTAFLAEHPRFAVLPAPYFEPECRPESYLDVAIAPYAFMPPGSPWYAEIDTGVVTRWPERGFSTARAHQAFAALGAQPVAKAEVRLFMQERSGLVRLIARVALPTLRPERFVSTYQRGPRARQLSRVWGEEGVSVVLLQLRHPARFWRAPEPYLYVGGDFLYQRIENVVRYLRTHGMNVYGFKPDYGRDPQESVEAMTRADYPAVRRYLELVAPARRARVVGLCLGGIHGRGLAALDAGASIESVTGIAAPHQGSELADIYNNYAIFPFVHRFFTGDAQLHQYKDTVEAMQAFNRAVPPPPGVPHYAVVLDPTGHRIDPRYDATVASLQWLKARETGLPPSQIKTDGLILVEGQDFGQVISTWVCDHAGMINDGLSGSYFDAYSAHRDLVEALHDR